MGHVGPEEVRMRSILKRPCEAGGKLSGADGHFLTLMSRYVQII